MNRQEAFEELVRRGMAEAKVEFSGGGDEGGVDNVILTDDKGNHHEISPYQCDSKDEEFIEALSEPIDNEYGSFAGEFQVSGCVIWNVADKKVRMQKAETEWVDSEYEV
ncbi:MAG: hypothetical protein DWQ19_08805 [Crenarchaeota archaeon]|nr:MAG: hypothetical protein DWQ19_08805 [Thermoproteota archaeon]